MSEGKPSLDEAALPLPETAPLVRMTAGLGSAGQKTWNLRKPITLVGAKRPAHVVLKDRNISKAHCVLVNTGTEVLLRDLSTSAGTTCNGNQVDLVVLTDGDFLTLASSHIQVAISAGQEDADDSGYGLEYIEPTKMVSPATVRLQHTDREWVVETAVAFIGRHKGADILLDHEAIEMRHAVLFRYGKEVAVYDLGGGVSVDGKRCTMALLTDGAKVSVGPFVLCISVPKPAAGQLDEPSPQQEPASKEEAPPADMAVPAPPPEAVKPPAGAPGSQSIDADTDPAVALEHIEAKLGQLQKNIQGSWDRMNTWESRLRDNADELGRQEVNLAERTSEVEAKEAALRGQLHDLSRYHEQISEREQELAQQLANIQQAQDELSGVESALKEREEAVARRAEELKRREHVFAQRWTRLLHATCPHCGKPVGEGS